MITPLIDPNYFHERAGQIRSRVPALLSQRRLLPKFSRWRLTQDPQTGLVVLFGVLNDEYIAAHSATPFNEYFDPRLLREMANDLQVQIVSCNSDGLRYAFILDRGSLRELPAREDFPFLEGDGPLVSVIPTEGPATGLMSPQTRPTPAENDRVAGDTTQGNEASEAFLKLFDDIKR